jgi:phospholipid/cholesterol/gamma-HCH transport system permease protein
MLGLSPEQYTANIVLYGQLSDVFFGMTKSAVFGFILSWVGCYKGYYASSGARGVGKATTQAVVYGSVLILMFNYVLSKCFEAL